ncbi:MAG TPA: hypothetical protein VFV10_06890 [Gammaproteobacteria bacterium]|nr:hypothetical protein [Gammaproteobacteria bacterium]
MMADAHAGWARTKSRACVRRVAAVVASAAAAAAAMAVAGCACVGRVPPTPEKIARFVHPGDSVRMKIYTGGRLKLVVTGVGSGQIKGRENGDPQHPVWVSFGAIRSLRRECPERSRMRLRPSGADAPESARATRQDGPSELPRCRDPVRGDT